MKAQNRLMTIIVSDNILQVTNRQSGKVLKLAWPAAAVSIRGKRIEAGHASGEPAVTGKSISQSFADGGLKFKVTLKLADGGWFKKRVDVSAKKILPAPDYVEVDSQRLDDDLELCGYSAKTLPEKEVRGEEEGIGRMPGCGYPLIGKKYFTGLEHPAGFNLPEKVKGGTAYKLQHYPQWEGRRLEIVEAVFGWRDNPRAGFFEYLDTIRIPPLKKPLVSFCTFWADPYIGNYEYAVSYENYLSFFKAFAKFDLIPDVFTLDAGWNDRQSVFQAKESVGRDKGLKKLTDAVEDIGAKISLWLSHNGPMGISPEYMARNGMETGSGDSAAYCGKGYGIMMDKKFGQLLEERFCELIRKIGAIHFKIDWDNECAANPGIKEKYPTRNHVRQASMNVMFAIDKAMRKVKPDIITRNGWWASPWWLSHANHLWLSDSGDSEYASLPSKSQRDSSTTHRDIMYYNMLQRDKSVIPLDCFDNHEFPDAMRNPFVEAPGLWTNALWMSFMRGSSYLAYTLQPEKLEAWQADSFRKIMAFCRKNSKHIFVHNGRMILGNPNKGEMYGFFQPGADESWCVIRNPLPVPQTLKFNSPELAEHKVKTVYQFYPHYEFMNPESSIMLLAHEVKVLILSKDKIKPVFPYLYMAEKRGSKYEYRFPASLCVNNKVRPYVEQIYQMPELNVSGLEKAASANELKVYFTMRAPYRMRDFELQVRIKAPEAEKVRLQVFVSRYPKAEGSCYAIPVTEIPWNQPGYGESRNLCPDIDRNQKFFAAQVPDGGEAHYRMIFSGPGLKKADIEVWAAGYEAPSRESIVIDNAPPSFEECLPCQFPQGFGRAIRIEL
ncbi:MAG: hypothetical protein ACYC4Q_05395 [Victivallaceae bacterium]